MGGGGTGVPIIIIGCGGGVTGLGLLTSTSLTGRGATGKSTPPKAALQFAHCAKPSKTK